MYFREGLQPVDQVDHQPHIWSTFLNFLSSFLRFTSAAPLILLALLDSGHHVLAPDSGHGAGLDLTPYNSGEFLLPQHVVKELVLNLTSKKAGNFFFPDT